MSSLTVCAVLDIDLSRIPRAAYPLVILAISLENMFRLIYAVILTPSENSSSSRVGSAFGQTAHIALASTMQNVAILVGLSTVVSPGVAGFCIFAAIATMFDYFYLSTFFLSILSVDVRRIELEDELSKASKLRHNNTYELLEDRPSWMFNFLKGRVALSTRIAGTIVMIGFVIIAQWHFFGDVGVWEPAKRLFGASPWKPPATDDTYLPLKEIHQARSPNSWLRLQDHETAQEVINAIKPSAFSYTAKVYDPLVFVLKNSNRMPPQQKKKFLPAAYDFVDHQLAEFVISIVLVGACLRLLASYLLLADEDTKGDLPESAANPSLSVKTLSGGHLLDVAMIAASTDGQIVSAGLDRTIRVWNVRSDGTDYELPEGSEAIAACAPSGSAGGGWCTWEEAIVTKKRIKDPGTWEIVKGRSVIGVRQEANHSRNTKRQDYRRRSAAARRDLGQTTKWQAWTAATDEQFEADEVRPLANEGPGSEEFLVVPGLGPKAKIGLRSVAFTLGNSIKIVSAGGPERYKGDTGSAVESFLIKDSRRGRHGGSMRGRN
ncbi:hypothetical protein V2A60_004605 [Cordyceps javanica]